jgi:hypothetical protein
MHFYTSINNNYLPKARILAKSVKKHCLNAKFSLILADRLPKEINVEDEPFDEIITIENIGLPVENLDMWIYMHTVVELCTAVKGQALVKFLEEGAEKVVYLDPDIAVFNDLHQLEQLLDMYDIILTPHQTVPETHKQDIINNEICSLKHGTYNYGFYAVKNSANGIKYAQWWRDRLVEFCYDDIPNGIFTDQKWGDLVPAMFDGVHILKDPGCNVSTWNLSNRTVTLSKEGIYYVNDSPLKFYHFSGFDSGAQEIMLNVYAKKNQILFDLREWYIRRQNEEGQELYGGIQSVYDKYDNGEKIDKNERVLIRRRLDVQEYFKNINPFVVEQEKSYHKWYINEMAKNGCADGSNSDGVRLHQLEMELFNIYNSRTWKLVNKLKKVLRPILYKK